MKKLEFVSHDFFFILFSLFNKSKNKENFLNQIEHKMLRFMNESAPTYMTWSILNMIFGFPTLFGFFFSVSALIQSITTRDANYFGNYPLAWTTSYRAKITNVYALFFNIFSYALIVAIVVPIVVITQRNK